MFQCKKYLKNCKWSLFLFDECRNPNGIFVNHFLKIVFSCLKQAMWVTTYLRKKISPQEFFTKNYSFNDKTFHEHKNREEWLISCSYATWSQQWLWLLDAVHTFTFTFYLLVYSIYVFLQNRILDKVQKKDCLIRAANTPQQARKSNYLHFSAIGISFFASK